MGRQDFGLAADLNTDIMEYTCTSAAEGSTQLLTIGDTCSNGEINPPLLYITGLSPMQT